MALTFVEKVCYNQIKYLGVLDTVRMRKDCYHVRMAYQEFYRKFGILHGTIQEQLELAEGKYSDKECKEMVKSLMDNNFKGASLDFLYGHNRIFMKM
jgi:myosin heavy subunit